MTSCTLMESAPGPETTIDGVRFLYFGGTGYLGLAARPEVIEAGCAALRQYGVHSATTRSRWGTIPPVQDVERGAAEFFGTETAFYFASGYVTNHILVSALAKSADAVFVDASAHYSVLEAARLADRPATVFPPREAEALGRLVAGHRRVLVLADAVGPASGEVAPVMDYLRVLERCEQAMLVLDDAHGIGVLGPEGRGLLDELGLWSQANRGPFGAGVHLAVGGTLAKALGGFGGIVPGTGVFVAGAREGSHYFGGASAPASAVAGSSAKALDIARREPELRLRLRANTQRLRAGLRGLGLTVPAGATAHFGVSVGDAVNMERIHAELKARGVLVPYVRAYSGIPPEGVLRFAVFANHSNEQIDRLIAALRPLL